MLEGEPPKTCPCCRGVAVVCSNHEYASMHVTSAQYFVICSICGLRTGLFGVRDHAVTVWNYRRED